MKKVAVAILNWNGERLLPKFLPSVLSNSPEGSVYVIDNGSSDRSVELLQQNFPDVQLISFEDNHGFSEGYNLGLAEIEAEIVVLLNSDVEVTPNWLDPILKEFDSNENTCAVQPKIRSYQEKEFFEYAGAAGGYIDCYGYPFCQGRVLNEIEKDLGQYDQRTRIFWASGACMAIRKNTYFKAGGLDPHFFAHMEEIDLCWRLNRMGNEVIYLPDSVVYHLGGASLQAGDPRKTFLNFRNNLLLLAKNLNGKEFYRILVPRLFLDGAAAIKFLLSGSLREFLAVIRAHFAFYGDWREVREENRDIRKPALRNLPGTFKGLLPWQFYIKKKKTFSEIMSNNPK